MRTFTIYLPFTVSELCLHPVLWEDDGVPILQLRDGQWARIEGLLQGKPGDRGQTGADNRLFVEAVLLMARTGAPWRDLPPAFGP